MRAYIVCDPNNSGNGTFANMCMESCEKNNIVVEKFGIFDNFITHLTNNNLKMPEDDEIFSRYFKVHPELCFNAYNDIPLVRLGVIGCFLSHFYLWKKCIETNEPILILEHDAEIIKSIDWFNDLNANEWDIILLDPCIACLVEGFNQHGCIPYMECVANTVNLETSIIPFDKNYNSPHDVPGFGCHPPASHGYIVTPNGARKIVERVLSNCILPSDVCLNGNRINIGVATNNYVKIQDGMAYNPIAQSSTVHVDYSKDTLREWALWICYKRGILPLEENIIQIINKSLTR